MQLPDRRVSVDLTVPFHDCDPLFIVWHGRYFQYLEIARTELFRSFELDVPDIGALGYRMYVTEARCRYLAPLRYGESIRVSAWFSSLEPLVRVAYEVFNVSTGRKAARGHTDLATTDTSGALVTQIPPQVRSRLTHSPEQT